MLSVSLDRVVTSKVRFNKRYPSSSYISMSAVISHLLLQSRVTIVFKSEWRLVGLFRLNFSLSLAQAVGASEAVEMSGIRPRSIFNKRKPFAGRDR